jgi:hypothetical protein
VPEDRKDRNFNEYLGILSSEENKTRERRDRGLGRKRQRGVRVWLWLVVAQ